MYETLFMMSARAGHNIAVCDDTRFISVCSETEPWLLQAIRIESDKISAKN